MPTFDRTTRKYFTISKEDHPDGLIRHKDSQGNVSHFHGLEGILTSIELKKDVFEGDEQIKYLFHFEDENNSQVDILQIGEGASAARGLIMSLYSCPGEVGWVSVEPFRKKHDDKTYTNLWTKINGEDVEWMDELTENMPDVKEVRVGDKKILDDSDRRKYIRILAKRVMNQKISGKVLHDLQADQQTKRTEQPKQPEGPELNGDQAARDIYDEPGSKQQQPKQDPRNELDMEGWDQDIDDDLPF